MSSEHALASHPSRRGVPRLAGDAAAPSAPPSSGTPIPDLFLSHMPMQPLATMSPLRYPGSKRKLAPGIATLIRGSGRRPSLFVEPFCGGASVALRLLYADLVDHVVLADADPLVGAFWHTVVHDHEWLIQAMRAEPVTLERWDHWRQARPRGLRNRALKCLFLNRTTFSGILHGRAGPIGGRAQTGDYLIDCRFSKDGIAERIEQLASLVAAGRIVDAWWCDWREALERAAGLEGGSHIGSTLAYLDPPYIEKADRLYSTGFRVSDHRALAAALSTHEELDWILSYDDVPAVRSKYQGLGGVKVFRPAHTYTATGSRKGHLPGRELFFTNLDLPGDLYGRGRQG